MTGEPVRAGRLKVEQGDEIGGGEGHARLGGSRTLWRLRAGFVNPGKGERLAGARAWRCRSSDFSFKYGLISAHHVTLP